MEVYDRDQFLEHSHDSQRPLRVQVKSFGSGLQYAKGGGTIESVIEQEQPGVHDGLGGREENSKKKKICEQ